QNRTFPDTGRRERFDNASAWFRYAVPDDQKADFGRFAGYFRGGGYKGHVILHRVVPGHQSDHQIIVCKPKLLPNLTSSRSIRSEPIAIESIRQQDSSACIVAQLLMLPRASQRVVDDRVRTT